MIRAVGKPVLKVEDFRKDSIIVDLTLDNNLTKVTIFGALKIISGNELSKNSLEAIEMNTEPNGESNRKVLQKRTIIIRHT